MRTLHIRLLQVGTGVIGSVAHALLLVAWVLHVKVVLGQVSIVVVHVDFTCFVAAQVVVALPHFVTGCVVHYILLQRRVNSDLIVQHRLILSVLDTHLFGLVGTLTNMH